ncbi:hypothetical protein J5N97_002288 [Dioscorea zingiberensis]|uniref:Pentatricopeptide repeat-containing protein n=1 Tax=Dioscorea zingiberensis TaxID=325984 RepID=A0A9D5D3T3_9LILI|nr:hypothetical protein J5N97_002288 [Dioscorea zingiberensis]
MRRCCFVHVWTKRQFTSVLQFGTFAFCKQSVKGEREGLDEALKVSDIMTPKTSTTLRIDCHRRLIQWCMQDLLDVSRQKCTEDVKKSAAGNFKANSEQIFCTDDFQGLETSKTMKVDSLLLFLELHKRGVQMDETNISCIMSSCGTELSLTMGMQLHALSIKFGFDMSVHVASSLISLYSKCGQLCNAYQVFQWMPVRNAISWTALIASYAQHCETETCLSLFIQMRRSMLKPNDFTFASILSACTSTASLGLGRSIHCLEVRIGFDSYVHIANALISMYAKCGSIEEARCVFEKMLHRDLISWNSMIFGFAHNGLAKQAVDLLKCMDRENVKPDAISFLGVLSSCRHTGLVEIGRWCFNSIQKHGIQPELDHYSCIVDLLGRAGFIEEASGFIENMPMPPNAVIWGSLLSSCRVHGNVRIGIQAAENRLLLEPSCAATHVQLAKLYASVGCWHQVARVRKLMKERGLKTVPGYSWIEIGSAVYRFKAEDGSNKKFNEILNVLDCLADHMKFFLQDDPKDSMRNPMH